MAREGNIMLDQWITYTPLSEF